MRTGACTIQQTLTAEAASVLKHSLSLARRRGHAQVTPLHVAATLLSSRSSLLRRACLKSHPNTTHNYQLAPSHPLQCRALELCFNVALNRLPTIPGPMFHGQPSLSNALIAALKRAQAHQRRGCIEQQQQQQQPLLTIKVELEQLVISILDDPSVSRVMREAGFSSIAVKSCIEDCSISTVFYGSSVGVFSSPCSPSSNDQTHRDFYQPVINPNTFWQTHFLNHSAEQNPVFISPQKKVFNPDSSYSVKEDMKLVVDVLLRKKKNNPVIVGDSLSVTEGLVSELTGNIEKGDIHDDLKRTHLVKFQFSPVALKFMKKEDVETNMKELKKKVDSLASCGKDAIIFTGDLKWTVNDISNGDQITSRSGYSPLDHLVEEIGRFVYDYNNSNNTSSNTRVWVLGTASYQTYMRCQMRQPPLETLWSLQAVSVPSGGLGLTLHASSARESRIAFSENPCQVLETKPFAGKDEENMLTCCIECTSNYEKEAQAFKSGQQKLLPSWLQQHGDNANQKDELVRLRRKWNRFCQNLHQARVTPPSQFASVLCGNQGSIGRSYSYSSSYPWWMNQISPLSEPASISFADSALKPNQRSSNSVAKFRRQNSCTIEFDLGNESHKHQNCQPKLQPFEESDGKEAKITLDLGHSLFGLDSGKLDGGKCGEGTKWKRNLYKVLQENVPWQTENLPSIVEILMDSFSSKKDMCMLIQGNDTAGKRRLACAIAEYIFGSVEFLVQTSMSSEAGDRSTPREMIMSLLKNKKKLVVLVEDIDLADTQFVKLLADKFKDRSNENDGQAILILATGDSSSNVDDRKGQDSVIQMILKVNESKLDKKRPAEWDLLAKVKSPRTRENEDACSVVAETGCIKKDFSRQSSFNSTLDLNLKADEDDEGEVKPGEISPIASDLTREISWDPHSSNGFLGLIQNRFVFRKSPKEDIEVREAFSVKIKKSFEEVFGGQSTVSFSVEERVLEELYTGAGYFLNSSFENWLREAFQTSLKTVKIGGKENTGVIRLCFGGIVEKVVEGGGFMDTCLPKKVQVSYVE